MNNKKGSLFVISGPSGVGKGTICDIIKNNRKDLYLSVSATSRSPRPGEVDGVNYYFKTNDQMEEMIKNGELLEHATYVSNTYGTPKVPCMENLSKGKNVILEIEIQGGLQVKENYPEAVLIFVVPPTLKELENRLRGRGTESEEKIKSRLKRAKEELLYIDKYDYIIVNDTVENAVSSINTIIDSQSFKKENTLKFIKEELGL